MPSLTDTAIRHALKRVEVSQKQENLADGDGRGTGRLVLVLKPMPKRVTADWMAQQWRDGKRTKKKIGAYPSMSLVDARAVFKRDFADVIQKGRSIKIATDTRPGTVADLFEGYVASLKAAGKPVKLAPGGYHVMLMDLKQPLKAGESVPLILTVEGKEKKTETIEVKGEVRDLTAAPLASQPMKN